MVIDFGLDVLMVAKIVILDPVDYLIDARWAHCRKLCTDRRKWIGIFPDRYANHELPVRKLYLIILFFRPNGIYSRYCVGTSCRAPK